MATDEEGKYEEPLTIRPMPGVCITVDGPMDEEVLAIGVVLAMVDRVSDPKTVLKFVTSRFLISEDAS